MTAPRVNLIVLRVADIDRSAEFYKLLGLDFIKHAHGKGPQHYSCELYEVVFELYQATATQQVSSSARIGFVVEDLDRVLAALVAYPEAKLIAAPIDSEWGRRAVVGDPDGHRIELTARGE